MSDLDNLSVEELRVLAGYDSPPVKGGHVEEGLKSATSAGKHAQSKGGVRKYAAMIPRSLSALPGYTADLLQLGPNLVAHGIGALKGKPFEQPAGYGQRTKDVIDKATGNYAKPSTKGEKIYEAILDVVGPGKTKAAETIAKKIGKTAVSRIPRGALAGIGEATDSPFIVGLGAPVAFGAGKGALNYLRHKRNLSNVKKHQGRFIQDISEKSKHHFDPFTHEVAGHSLQRNATKGAYKDAQIEASDARKALEKIKEAQASHVSAEKVNRQSFRSNKKTYEQAYLNPTDLKRLSGREPEAIGAALQEGAKKTKDMWGNYVNKRYNTPEMLNFQETAKIHGDPAIEWFAQSYHNLENPSLKKQLVNTPVGKTVKSIMGLNEDASPAAFEEALRKLGPTTLNYHETKQLLGALSDAAGDQSGIYGKNAKKQLNHLAGNLSKQVEEAAEFAGIGPQYQKNKKIVKLQKEHIVDPVNMALTPGKDTAVSYHNIVADKGKSSKVLEQARKSLPLEEQRALGETILKNIGFEGGDFSSTAMRRKFLNLPKSSQESIFKMLDPDTRGKLKVHLSHPETYESINKRLPEYIPIYKEAKQKAKQALEDVKPKEITEAPAALFQKHQADVLSGKAKPKFASTSSALIRDMGKNSLGEHDISTLQTALKRAQPEVREAILGRLTPSVRKSLSEGATELDFLNKIAGSRHGMEGAADLVSNVSTKAGTVKKAINKVFYANPEKQYKKAKNAYEMERTGTTPKFFKPNISAIGIRSAARSLYPRHDSDADSLDNLSVEELRKIAGYD